MYIHIYIYIYIHTSMDRINHTKPSQSLTWIYVPL